MGRAEVLSSIFFLLSLLAYTKGILTKVINNRLPLSSWMYIGLSVLLAIFSMLSKEQGITVLAISVSFDVLVHWPVILRYVFNVKFRKKDNCKGEERDGKGGQERSSGEVTIPPSNLPQVSFTTIISRIGMLEACLYIMFLHTLNFRIHVVFWCGDHVDKIISQCWR